MKNVICDHKTNKCPDKCEHSKPHDPIKDITSRTYIIHFCHLVPDLCGWIVDGELCFCIETTNAPK